MLDNDTDVLILAGDIQTFDCLIEYFSVNQALSEYFSGNNNVHFLVKSSVVIEGVNFYGATLWSGFNAYPQYELDVSKNTASKIITDFKAISIEDRRFKPEDCQYLFTESYHWLEQSLRKSQEYILINVPYW